MTIRKGEDWGHQAPLPADGVVVRSDAEARVVLEEYRHAGEAFPSLGLLGGDLCRTLGGTGDEDRLRSDAAMTFPIDLGQALVDGRLHLFIAHAVVRNGLWRRSVVAMNAQWIGGWNVGHRAHPNDGFLDVYESDLRMNELLKVRRRLPSGTHLPHPRIDHRRTAAAQFSFTRSQAVRLDGIIVAAGRDLSIRLQPDALRVVV